MPVLLLLPHLNYRTSQEAEASNYFETLSPPLKSVASARDLCLNSRSRESFSLAGNCPLIACASWASASPGRSICFIRQTPLLVVLPKNLRPDHGPSIEPLLCAADSRRRRTHVPET